MCRRSNLAGGNLTKGCSGLGVGQLALLLFLGTLLGILTSPRSAAGAPRSCQASGDSGNQTSKDYNQRLKELFQLAGSSNPFASAGDYRIGPADLLDVSVYGAPDLSAEVRVASDGSIFLPLIGTLRAAGLNSRELGSVIEELLKRTYMKDPHVSVSVKDMESHSVSVFGAVEKPGVFQIRSPKSLIEVLSLAQGLAVDAGDTVIVMRHPDDHLSLAVAANGQPAAPAVTEVNLTSTRSVLQRSNLLDTGAAGQSSVRISLKELLDSGDPQYNVPVYPGDVVEVTRAGIVYVVGEVNKPGGYLLKTNENISVLQAIALAEGETHTASGKHARIIRTNSITGARTEIPINLNKILSGHAQDPVLQARDIVFVPNNAGKAALYRSTEGIVATVSGAAIYRW
jgi:polysaccharide biosynthesis/export protein